MEPRRIEVELTPWERAALLKFRYTIDEIRSQLKACASSHDVATIIFNGGDVHLLAGDLNHVIVKQGCRDVDIMDLCDRFDYINDTGDGSFDAWS